MKQLPAITLCLALCLAIFSCAGAPQVILDLEKTPASVRRAASLFEAGKNLEGLYVLSAVLSAKTKAPDAVALWASKGEPVFTALEYQLSLGTGYANPEEAKKLADRIAIRDHVRENLIQGGWKTPRVWLVGDSTIQDYSIRPDYLTKYYPMTGWGEKFQDVLSFKNLPAIRSVIDADTAVVINRGRGGRSTRTFWEEGSWKPIYAALLPGDYVFIQFGHNDCSADYPDRFVDIPGFKKYLGMYIAQTREKGATPVLCTPVNRNYPWSREGVISNVHGKYPEAMRETARETGTLLIDMSQRSIDLFNSKGREYVTSRYFMVFLADAYPQSYPKGNSDNTHFRTEGALALAGLAWEGLLALVKK